MKKNILFFALVCVLISAVPSFCAPAEPPPEVAAGATQEEAQTWSEDKTTQNWPTALLASGYTLYRGTLAELQNLLNGNSDSCARYTGTTTGVNLSEDDPSTVEGRFFWYIVTGYNSFGEGPSGSATAGARDLDPGSSCGSSYCGDGYCDGNEGAWCPDCPPVCGDGICSPSEVGNCSDCGPFCGDGICDPGEECGSCADCSPCCGDAVCDAGEEGWCADCPPTPYCGDGICDPGEEGWCADCPPDPYCGDGNCDPGEEGNCSDCGPYCGDGICDPEESCGGCADCSPCCGDGTCDGGEEGWCVDCT